MKTVTPDVSVIRFTGSNYVLTGFDSAHIKPVINTRRRGSTPIKERFSGHDPFPPAPDVHSWCAIIRIFIPSLTHSALDRLHRGVVPYDLWKVELDDGTFLTPTKPNWLDVKEVPTDRHIVALLYRERV